MRPHETYETFCRWCLRRFERATLAESHAATEEHEKACVSPKKPVMIAKEFLPI